MAAGVMTQAWRVSKAATWTGAIYLWVGRRGVPRDLSDAAASLTLQPPRGSSGRLPFTASTANGRLSVNGSVVVIAVPQPDMATLGEGDWPFDLYVTYPDAVTEWTLTGVIRVLASGGGQFAPGPSAVDVIQSADAVEVVSGAQGPPGAPARIAVSASLWGLMGAGERLGGFLVKGGDIRIDASASAAVAYRGATATSAIAIVMADGSTAGTIAFAAAGQAGQQSGVITLNVDRFVDGDHGWFVAPPISDPTLSDIVITLSGA